jgi:hypothetical protein
MANKKTVKRYGRTKRNKTYKRSQNKTKSMHHKTKRIQNKTKRMHHKTKSMRSKRMHRKKYMRGGDTAYFDETNIINSLIEAYNNNDIKNREGILVEDYLGYLFFTDENMETDKILKLGNMDKVLTYKIRYISSDEAVAMYNRAHKDKKIELEDFNKYEEFLNNGITCPPNSSCRFVGWLIKNYVSTGLTREQIKDKYIKAFEPVVLTRLEQIKEGKEKAAEKRNEIINQIDALFADIIIDENAAPNDLTNAVKQASIIARTASQASDITPSQLKAVENYAKRLDETSKEIETANSGKKKEGIFRNLIRWFKREKKKSEKKQEIEEVSTFRTEPGPEPEHVYSHLYPNAPTHYNVNEDPYAKSTKRRSSRKSGKYDVLAPHDPYIGSLQGDESNATPPGVRYNLAGPRGRPGSESRIYAVPDETEGRPGSYASIKEHPDPGYSLPTERPVSYAKAPGTPVEN